MRVNEIFSSIEGEGVRAGELCTFIRLSGCNLRCKYCDTKYAFYEGENVNIDEILQIVKKMGNKNVTLTGGEPLLNKKESIRLVSELIVNGFFVNIETNGTINPSMYQNEYTIITMDYKTNVSGESDKMNEEYIKMLRSCDVLKFVVSEKDFNQVEDVIKRTRPNCYVYLSPVFGECESKKIVDFMKNLNNKGFDMSKTRVQLQLHKYIWNPDERGV